MVGCASQNPPPPKPDPAVSAVGEEVRVRMPRDAANEDRPVYVLPRWSVGYHKAEGSPNYYRGGYVEAVEMEPGYFTTMEEAELSGRPYIFVDEGKFMLPDGEGNSAELQVAQMAARIKALEEQMPKVKQREEDGRLLAGANRPALAYDAFAPKPSARVKDVERGAGGVRDERRTAQKPKLPDIELEIGSPRAEPPSVARAEKLPAPEEMARPRPQEPSAPTRMTVTSPDLDSLPASRYFSGEIEPLARSESTGSIGAVAAMDGVARKSPPLVTELEIGSPAPEPTPAPKVPQASPAEVRSSRRIVTGEPAIRSRVEMDAPEPVELPAPRYFSGELPPVTRKIQTEPVGRVAMNRFDADDTDASEPSRPPLVTELEIGTPGEVGRNSGKTKHIELIGIGPAMHTVIVPPRPAGTVEIFAIPGSVDRLEIRHLEDGEVVFKWGDKYYKTRFEDVPKQVKIYR